MVSCTVPQQASPSPGSTCTGLRAFSGKVNPPPPATPGDCPLASSWVPGSQVPVIRGLVAPANEMEPVDSQHTANPGPGAHQSCFPITEDTPSDGWRAMVMNHLPYLSPSQSQLHRAGKMNVCRISPALLNNFPLKEATYQ